MLDARDPRIIADGIMQAVARLDGGSSRAGLARIWPPAPDSAAPTVGGASLGFLRYLSRAPATPLQVNTGRAYWIQLDAAVTAPNAIIGMHLGPSQPGPRSSWHFMRPGDVIYEPAGFDRAWIYNGDMLDQVAGGLPAAASRPVGYCAFRVGRYRGVKPPTSPGPAPFARLCGVGLITTTNLIIPCGGLRRLLVEILPVNAGGAIEYGSNCHARLLVYPMFRLPAVPTAVGLDGETWDSPSLAGLAHAETTHLTSVGAGTTLELPVEGLQFLRMQAFDLTTWVGPAIASLLAQVEGIP